MILLKNGCLFHCGQIYFINEKVRTKCRMFEFNLKYLKE